MEQRDLAEIFGRFAGQEVALTEHRHTMTMGGKVLEFTDTSLAPGGQPAVTGLRDEAARLGLQLRIWIPGMVATTELNPNRLNVHVEKSSDGRYRISERMSMEGAGGLKVSFDAIIARGTDRPVPVMAPLRLKNPSV